MKNIIILITLLYPCILLAAEPVPIVVGGDENMDACSSLAMINNLQADMVDGQLAVRSGPSANHNVVDKLKKGQRLWICRSASGWAGVVYQGSEEVNCGVTSTIYPERPYAGPCKSGWVRESAFDVIAG